MTAPSGGVRRLHGEYWETQASGSVRLTACRCTACGATYLPAIATCATCLGRDFARQALSDAGTLYSYTIVRGAGGVWPEVYAIGYVDFPENVRVCGHLRETDEDLLQVGMPVGIEDASLYRDPDGTEVTCFRFHRVEGTPR